MASMFAKLRAAKEEEKTVYIRDILEADDDRYFMIIKDGKILATGPIEEVRKQMGSEYFMTPIKYYSFDQITQTVKVIV